MGHKHEKDDILAGAMEVATAEGLSRLSFGRVARRVGINDRTVVYYFPTKTDLVSEVLFSVGAEMRATLEAAFTSNAANGRELAKAAWPVLAKEEADPLFALFFEATGLASAGQEPYRSLVPVLVEAWVEWAEQLIEGPEELRRGEAESAVALTDGLLLLRQLVGPEPAERAARRLGLVD